MRIWALRRGPCLFCGFSPGVQPAQSREQPYSNVEGTKAALGKGRGNEMCGLILWKGYTWVIRLWRTIGPNSDCTGSPGLGSFWVLWTLLCICDVVPSLWFYMGCVMPQHTQYAAMNCPGAISFFYPQHIALSLGDKQQTLLPWVFLPSHSTFFFLSSIFQFWWSLFPPVCTFVAFSPFSSHLLCSVSLYLPYVFYNPTCAASKYE